MDEAIKMSRKYKIEVEINSKKIQSDRNEEYKSPLA